MNFTKMQGLGNDFVVVAHYNQLPADADALAIKICDRHFGVGADGLVFILPSEKADFMMRIIMQTDQKRNSAEMRFVAWLNLSMTVV
jgi:diaminopimelate epimerase